MAEKQTTGGYPRGRLAFLLVAFTAILLAGAYVYYKSEERTIRKEKYNDLTAIAELKLDQINRWLKERDSEAHFFSENPSFIQHTKNLTHGVDAEEAFLYYRSRLTPFMKRHGYENIFLLDTNHKLIFSLDKDYSTVDSTTMHFSDSVKNRQEVMMTGFYECPTHKNVHLDILAPVAMKDAPFATLVFRVDPNDYLFPLIQSWPVSSETSETLILRRDGDSALFLNELRHMDNTALSLRVPMSRQDIPAVQAIKGYEGVFEGNDYRDVEVLSVVRNIERTPWYMIAKVDKEEVFAVLRYKAGAIIGFAVVLVLLAAAGLAWVYHYRQKNNFKNLYLKERELLRAQQEFKTTLYSIGDAVIITDRNSRITNMNPVAEDLTGWKEDSAVGKSLEDVFRIVHEETGEKVDNPAMRAMLEGGVIGLANHTVLISRSGKEIPIADSGAPIHDDQDNITGAVLVFRDQTQQRETVRKIEHSEAMMKKTQEMANVGSWEFDLLGNRLSWSDEVYRIFGMKPEHIKPSYEAFLEMIHPDDRQTVDKIYISSVEKGKDSYEIEHRIVRKDNQEVRHVIEKCDHIKDRNQKIIRSVGMVQDITERRKYEQKLIEQNEEYQSLNEEYMTQNEELAESLETIRKANKELKVAKARAEESDRLKTSFLNNMSHEIRTPMNSIMGFADLLRDNPPPEERKKHIEIINNNAEHLVKIIDDVINISRLESEKTRLDIASFSIHQLCNDLYESNHYKVESNGLQCIQKVDPSLKALRVISDKQKIRQVLTGFIDNAIKYTEHGTIEIGCRQAIDTLYFYVKDTGVGIPEDEQARVFERFYRGDRAQRLAIGGTGLGLSIAANIAKLLDGEIGVNSRPGQGSEFYFMVPLVKDLSVYSEVKPIAVSTDYLSMLDVLIAEDEPDSLQYLKILLDKKVRSLDEATSGYTAVEKSNQKAYHLVLMDIKMPGMDGLAATREIKRKNPSTVVIAQTAYVTPEEKRKANNAGCDDYLSKPIRQSELMASISKLFGKKK
ncbi:MAG: PAS domain S-box protein [Bacteroidales bacterium]|nr:PAS domain S-box protein [Bacteroidales bacterium]MCF8343010.1 PAS domain S-box protein [Bacteroidales bacterium]MCF8350314.1 PAS domain S-box protein [Bacteroidales bacterium]MCF8375982.1 PAS domain S-box protein [Bacteroidales bacterium]MCF8400470.1 PAS domain S-box protein [Bacteroidales bacterium]